MSCISGPRGSERFGSGSPSARTPKSTQAGVHTRIGGGFDGDGAVRYAQSDAATGRGNVQRPSVVGAEDRLCAREAGVERRRQRFEEVREGWEGDPPGDEDDMSLQRYRAKEHTKYAFGRTARTPARARRARAQGAKGAAGARVRVSIVLWQVCGIILICDVES
jgi:hypothetical protein